MSFWKPGKIAPGSQVDREIEEESSLFPVITHIDRSLQSLSTQRRSLPVFKYRNHLLFLVETSQVVIVVGETGSGKTTQIPQYLHEAGWTEGNRVVACTQPRRIAATSVAARVAEERHAHLGQEVGYTVRFDDMSHPNMTRIKFLTDGMLFRETLQDPLLSKYSVIMIDEAHERSLYTDILLGVLKKILKKRPELRLIISSATMDAKMFQDYFCRHHDPASNNSSLNRCSIISVEGRQYPVDIQYLNEPAANYKQVTIDTIIQIHQHELPGDVLVFLPGKDDIDFIIETVTDQLELLRSKKAIVLPLYAGLSPEDQLKALEPPTKGYRKIIVSTNMAETSVTLEGVVYVVDCGFAKIKSYNSRSAYESLIVTPISKASANQRAGRAGRTKPGKCFRLYTEESFAKLSPNTIPEIQRSKMITPILQLKAIGIDNVVRFDFISPPPADHIREALQILYSVKALEDYGRLTLPYGANLAESPLDPLLATCLLFSHQFKCTEEMLTIAAILSVQNIFIQPYGKRREAEDEKFKFAVEEGDHITYLNVFGAFLKYKKSSSWCSSRFLDFRALNRAISIRTQLKKFLQRYGVKMESSGQDTESIRKCLVSGFFSHAARLQPDGSYRSMTGNATLYIHPNSVLARRSPEWVFYHEVVETTKTFMRDVTVIDPNWLTELAPHFYEPVRI